MTDKENLEKIKKLADAMYYAAQQLTTDASRLHKAMGEYHKFIIHECKEEPVSEPIDFEKELYKAFGQVKDFTLGMRIAKWFYDMGKNGQEPISEDFETALEKKVREAQDWTYIEEEGGECPLNEEFGAYDLEEFARWGANWQKEQFEKNRLEHCNSITEEQYNLEVGFIDQHLDKYNRMPTYLDAIEYGIDYGKQQMMSKAVVYNDKIYPTTYENEPTEFCLDGGEEVRLITEAVNNGLLKQGDKVKVLIFKME